MLENLSWRWLKKNVGNITEIPFTTHYIVLYTLYRASVNQPEKKLTHDTTRCVVNATKEHHVILHIIMLNTLSLSTVL